MVTNPSKLMFKPLLQAVGRKGAFTWLVPKRAGDTGCVPEPSGRALVCPLPTGSIHLHVDQARGTSISFVPLAALDQSRRCPACHRWGISGLSLGLCRRGKSSSGATAGPARSGAALASSRGSALLPAGLCACDCHHGKVTTDVGWLWCPRPCSSSSHRECSSPLPDGICSAPCSAEQLSLPSLTALQWERTLAILPLPP